MAQGHRIADSGRQGRSTSRPSTRPQRTAARSGPAPDAAPALRPARRADRPAQLAGLTGLIDACLTLTPEQQCERGKQFLRSDDEAQYASAYLCFSLAALSHNTAAQFWLGMCYENAWGIPADRRKALIWYEKAAHRMHGPASAKLAVAYHGGQGRRLDLARARKYYARAGKQGLPRALLALGRMLANGEGGARDLPLAARCYRVAALQGDSQAQLYLGEMLYEGRGLPRNIEEAMDWYERAAQQDNDRAHLRLGMCHKQMAELVQAAFSPKPSPGRAARTGRPGEGLARQAVRQQAGHVRKLSGESWSYMEEAVKWFKSAAALGNTEAMVQLGLCYAEGKGVPTNIMEARLYYMQAALMNDGKANLILDSMTKKTAQARADAQFDSPRKS